MPTRSGHHRENTANSAIAPCAQGPAAPRRLTWPEAVVIVSVVTVAALAATGTTTRSWPSWVESPRSARQPPPPRSEARAMCRSEAPVDCRIRAVGEFAAHLRELRDQEQWTNAELAELLDVDVVTVRRAASSSTVPKRTFVEAWAETCGGKTDKPLAMWRQARAQYRRITSGRPGTALPNPDLVSTPEMLTTWGTIEVGACRSGGSAGG